MRLVLTILFITNLLTLNFAYSKNLKYGEMWAYQPILVNGEVVSEGNYNQTGFSHVMYDRYEGIKPILSEFDRPFTVLDLGANNGFFSLKIADEFDATCVMVDFTERLGDICEANTNLNNIISLNRRFTPQGLKKLGEKEHFDVIIAFHLLHNVPNWQEWMKELTKLGDVLLIETPPIDDPRVSNPKTCNDIAHYLLAQPNCKQIGSFPRGYGNVSDILAVMRMKSNSSSKQGISLSTFRRFGGSFPRQPFIKEILKKNKQDQVVLKGKDFYLE